MGGVARKIREAVTVENSQDEIQAKLKPSILLEVALEEEDEDLGLDPLDAFMEDGKGGEVAGCSCCSLLLHDVSQEK